MVSRQPGRVPWRGAVGLRVLLACAMAITIGAANGAAAPVEKTAVLRVLTLHGAELSLPGAVAQEEAIRATLRAGLQRPIEFFVEAFDGLRDDAAEHEPEFATFVDRKYRGRPPDLVFAVHAPALAFLERHRASLWTDVPVIFCGIAEEVVRDRPMAPGIAGVTARLDPQATLELAPQLQPDARRVAIVAGTAPYDRAWLPLLMETLRRQAEGMAIDVFTGLSLEETIERLRRLPPDSVVFYLSLARDALGNTFAPRDVLSRLAEVSPAPIYGLFETYLGHGIAGGALLSWADQGRRAARLGIDAFLGHRAPSGVQRSAPAIVRVDWQSLEHWHIPVDRVPAGVAMINQPPSLWNQHRGSAVIIAVATVTQSALLIGLLMQRRRRHRAERQVEEDQSELAHLSRVSALGQLSGSIAHELNQPLTAISTNTYAALALLSNRDVDLEEVRAILRDIAADDERAGEVIVRLREFLRRGETRRQTVDVEETIRHVLKLVHSEFAVRDVIVATPRAATRALVRADPIQLQQVVLNLVMNAADAMMSTAPARRAITILVETIDAGVQVSVRDQGPGIASADLSRVFESYYSTKASGLGLGLSICASIITAHNGRIWASNNPGQGATFWFTLPAVAA